MPHERVEHRELARGVVAEVPRIHKEEVRQPAGKKQPRDLQCHPDWGGEAQKNRGERPQAKISAGFPERVEDHEQEREVQKRDDRAAHHGEIEGTGGSGQIVSAQPERDAENGANNELSLGEAHLPRIHLQPFGNP